MLETRWNSTYLMLDVVFNIRCHFMNLIFTIQKYINELGKEIRNILSLLYFFYFF